MDSKTINSTNKEPTSLFDLIQQNNTITNEKKTLPSFGCLADLTAHHLKISNDSTPNERSSELGSRNSGFFIPKLSLKFEKKNSSDKCLSSEVSKLKIEDELVNNEETVILRNNPVELEVELNLLDSRINDIKKECSLLALQKKDFKTGQKQISLFGKVLCKKWSKRNISLVKNQKLLNNVNNILKFDFSTPSPDAQILARMRRCINSS